MTGLAAAIALASFDADLVSVFRRSVPSPSLQLSTNQNGTGFASDPMSAMKFRSTFEIRVPFHGRRTVEGVLRFPIDGEIWERKKRFRDPWSRIFSAMSNPANPSMFPCASRRQCAGKVFDGRGTVRPGIRLVQQRRRAAVLH